jgi:hypothetical protein
MNFFSYCHENLGRFGFKKLLYDLNYKFLERLFSYSKIQGMTLTMSSIDPLYLNPDNGYEYRFLTETELREYAKDPGNQINIKFLEDALDKKNKCYGIIDQGRLAGYGWYSKNNTKINDELVLCFNKSWVYMYSGYTKPPYRGQRLHAIGMGKAMEEFSSKGAKGLISCVDTNNYRSLQSVNRLGYRNFGKISAFKIFGKFRIKAENGCHPYGFTLKVAEKHMSDDAHLSRSF